MPCWPVSQLTKMLYEKTCRIQQECTWPYNFCMDADMLARDIVCVLFIQKL